MVRCRFGEFDIDVGARQLVRQGRAVHLSKKAFDLLAILLREQPTVVTKEQLYQELWPETFVGDANLMVLVGEIRKALGDSAHSPQFIRTAHGVGYAFAADTGGNDGPSSDARHWLLVSGRAIVLAAGENLIGRDPRAAVCLDYAGVSRRHARVVLDADGATLEDLGSKNGTRLGDAPVTTAVALRDGDSIRVGPEVIVYRKSEEGATTETQLG